MSELTERQKSIIIGSLLGDGNLSKKRTPGENPVFSKGQKLARKEYLEWHFNELKPFSKRLRVTTNTCCGKKYWRADFYTSSCPVLWSLREQWYPHGTKIVPNNIKLNPLSLAIWFCDDGSNELKGRLAKFHTCGFTKNGCEFLISLLSDFNIKDCALTPGNVIIVKSGSWKTLLDIIRPYIIWDCFRYKVKYRDRDLQRLTDKQTMEIYEMRKEGAKYREIAEKFKISISCASAASNKKTKSHLWTSTASKSI